MAEMHKAKCYTCHKIMGKPEIWFLKFKGFLRTLCEDCRDRQHFNKPFVAEPAKGDRNENI